MLCSGIVSACQNPVLPSRPLVKDKIKQTFAFPLLYPVLERTVTLYYPYSVMLPTRSQLTNKLQGADNKILTSIGTGCSIGNFALSGNKHHNSALHY